MFGKINLESTHDRVVASRVYNTGLPEYIEREVRNYAYFGYYYDIPWNH